MSFEFLFNQKTLTDVESASDAVNSSSHSPGRDVGANFHFAQGCCVTM
jgi:hypothetical protein